MPGLDGTKVGVALSSGFFGFFAHCGFVTALEEMGVEPAAVAGSSAGALVGAMWASGMDSARIRRTLTGVGLLDFVDLPRPWEVLTRPGGLLAGRKLERTLRKALPVETFEQCRFPVAVVVYDLERKCGRVVESGPLAPALRAALSLPFMFAPAPLDGSLCWDGGIVDKAAIAPLANRGGLDMILACYLDRPSEQGGPTTIAAGIRGALLSLMQPATQAIVDDARARGIEVRIVAPLVPRCGPHKLGKGPAIIDIAREQTHRIFEQGAFGCPDLR